MGKLMSCWLRRVRKIFVMATIMSACWLTGPAAWAKPVALFYLTDGPDSIRSFMAHYKQIDLVVPTWYEVDPEGLLAGEPDEAILDVARKDKLPVMPLVAMFDKKGFHQLAGNQAAWAKLNDALVREAK